MRQDTTLSLHNGETVGLDKVPRLDSFQFRDEVLRSVEEGRRLVAFFGTAEPGGIRLHAIMADSADGRLYPFSTLARDSFASLTPECPQAHLFEREIAERWEVAPYGHPWLKPIRFMKPPAGGDAPEPVAGVMDFFQVRGEEIHEVAAGPVCAGILEPGHFRFQCHGERVLHLEISLGYQHRGVEQALVGGPHARAIHLMETVAGDTSIGHTMAYCHAVESLAGARAPARAEVLRGVALELERLANHAGDLGALANDIGFLPTASFCGRLRGDFLNMTALLCGSRFGRGLVRPGGVAFDADKDRVALLRARLDAAMRDVKGAVNLLWETPTVLARFEEIGGVARESCEALGLVGVAARACGMERDVRFEFPFGIFRFAQIPVSTWRSGDVFARAYVRWLEMQRSADFVREQLEALQEEEVRAEVGALTPNAMVVSLVEGWRGEICHVALTDGAGRFTAYKVVDPSFHNWAGLAMAMRGQQISDFPLCNKSFNLSCCGHDL